MIYTVRQRPALHAEKDTREFPQGSVFAVARSSVSTLLVSEQNASSPITDNEELATRILTRIESRLPRRIRQLTVYASEHSVIIDGQCNTYYTKQMAQHAAMGVLNYERLINRIDVCPLS